MIGEGVYTHPGVGGDEHHATGVEVAFLAAEVDVNGARFDHDNFILAEMFVQRYFVSGMHVFRSENKMLGAIVLRTDLEHEGSGRRIAPDTGLAFIFLQQQWFGGRFRGRVRNELSSRLRKTKRYEHRAREGKIFANSSGPK